MSRNKEGVNFHQFAGNGEDDTSVERLEHEVAIFNILTGKTKRSDKSGRNSSPSAGVASGKSPPTMIDEPKTASNHSAEHHDEDDMSNLTDDRSATSTRLSQVRESVQGVLSQSLALLRGENPLAETGESERDLDIDGDVVGEVVGADHESDFVDEAQEPEPEQGKGPLLRSITERRNSSRRNSSVSMEPLNFLQDEKKDMTYGRRIALHLMKKNWYYPRPDNELGDVSESDDADKTCGSKTEKDVEGDDNSSTLQREKPNLEKAWAYFDHVTLPRYVFHPKEDGGSKKNICVRMFRRLFLKGSQKLDRAEPGEKFMETRLYSPFFTPLSQMGDFGLGVGLYFSTLRAITVLTLCAGLLCIPNLLYFSGEEYSASQVGVRTLIQGSAICTRTKWVPCPKCEDEFDDAKDRITKVTVNDGSGNDKTFTFALQNDCDGATTQQGFINYGALFLIIVGILFVNRYQKIKEIQFDEDEQTAQDYSIQIQNPPPDATEPEEWRKFFADNFDGAQVTCCTVAVDNDLLVRSLVERRECLRKLEMILPPGTSLDNLNLARIAAKIERERSSLKGLLARVVPDVPEIFGRVVVLNAKIQGLSQQDYPATNIFITFEKESHQRNVLAALGSVGTISVWRNKTGAVANPAHLFRGELVLNVLEADEPSTVRWQDLNVKLKAKMKQLFWTTVAFLGAVVGVAFLVRVCRDVDATFAAFAIAFFNTAFPLFAKLLTNFEAHSSEGTKQTSLYMKIAVFRWVNTAIVITIITPFTSTISDGSKDLIQQIYTIFFAEIVTTNAIQLADPVGHLQRHILAPRAPTQDLMNLKMGGSAYELAERYTNMTKILFLALWYSSVYPAALFMCSFALFINFFTDRFSLMRTWKPAPKLGTRISRFSRRYFFSTAIVAMAIISSYSWAGFPFDNLCVSDSSAGDSQYMYNGTFVIDGDAFEVSTEDLVYRYCDQNLWTRKDNICFPASSKWQTNGDQWMTEEQETVVDVYGWTSIGVLAYVCLKILWLYTREFMTLFRGHYQPKGKDMEQDFHEVPSIGTYIPQVQSDVFSYPLLACCIDGIDEELFDWCDPEKPYAYYDLTNDAKELLHGISVTEDASNHVFTKIAYWPA